MQFKEWLLAEEFDKISDFLLNPTHRDKTFEELYKEFQASGGKIIGSGSKGQVFEHPNWPYVLKTVNHDDCYIAFVRWAYQHPHPAFPKFFGPPRRIVPFYTRTKSETQIYLIRTEKLQPVADATMLKNIIDTAQVSIGYFVAAEHGYLNREEDVLNPDRVARKTQRYVKVKSYQFWFDFFKQYPKVKTLFEGLYILNKQKFKCALDIHKNNVMQRANGDLVWVDPLWEGSNPYKDAQKAMDIELDIQKEPQPINVPGGRFPIKKRIRPRKPAAQAPVDDNIPF